MMLDFKSMDDVNKWIDEQARKYGSKQKFFSSKEYREAYKEIKKIHEQEKKRFKQQKMKDKTVELTKDRGAFGLKLVYKKGYITPIGPFGMGGGEFPFKSEKDARDYAKKYKFIVKAGVIMYYVVLKKGTQYYVVCEGKGGGVYLVKVDIKDDKPNLPKKHKIAYLEKKDADNWKKNKAFDVEVIPKGKLVSSNAIHELKRLYSLNPDLAHKAAKVLGYRITAS